MDSAEMRECLERIYTALLNIEHTWAGSFMGTECPSCKEEHPSHSYDCELKQLMNDIKNQIKGMR